MFSLSLVRGMMSAPVFRDHDVVLFRDDIHGPASGLDVNASPRPDVISKLASSWP